MALFGFSKKKEKRVQSSNTELVVDIGTENVKTILFRKDEDATIIGYNLFRQKEYAMNKALIADFDSVLKAVDHSIGLAIKMAEERFEKIQLPTSVSIGIAGELVTGMPVDVSVERDEPSEKITKAEIEDTITKVKEHTFESSREEIAEEIGLSENQLEEIETSLNGVLVDDIKTSDPIGLTGNTVTYKVFSTFAPKIQIESIQKLCDHLKLRLTQLVVEPFALAKSLDEIMKDKVGGIIIDIGAGTSDVVVIKEGDIYGVKMFAIGGRVFTKRIQKEMDLEYDDAEDLKLRYANQDIDNYQKKEIKSILKQDIKSWLLGVELALEEMEDVDEYPPQIYICGGGSLLPDITNGLMEHPWIQSLNFKKHPKVNLLLPNKIGGIQDLTREVKNPIDVTPVAISKYIFDKIKK